MTHPTGEGNPRNVPVVQYTLDDVKVKEYCSATEASRQTGINASSIRRCLYGENLRSTQRVMLQAGGYKWKFKDENRTTSVKARLSDDDLNDIKETTGKLSTRIIANYLGTTPTTICYWQRILGIYQYGYAFWNSSKVKHLKRLIGAGTPKPFMAELLCCEPEDIDFVLKYIDV